MENKAKSRSPSARRFPVYKAPADRSALCRQDQEAWRWGNCLVETRGPWGMGLSKISPWVSLPFPDLEDTVVVEPRVLLLPLRTLSLQEEKGLDTGASVQTANNPPTPAETGFDQRLHCRPVPGPGTRSDSTGEHCCSSHCRLIVIQVLQASRSGDNCH